MQEKGCAYIIYAIFDFENGDMGYLLLDVWLCAVKIPRIPQEYADLVDVFNKRAAYALLNSISVKHEIDIRDKQPPFRLIYNLLENKLATLQ